MALRKHGTGQIIEEQDQISTEASQSEQDPGWGTDDEKDLAEESGK